jgi:hypothetical protein
MKSRSIIIGIVTLLLLVGGGYYYSTVNPDFKAKSASLIQKHILGETEEFIENVVTKNIYAIADGTASRYLDYAIPELDVRFITTTLNSLYDGDGGKFWLSYIDRDSKNNEVLYLKVEARKTRRAPAREAGETSFAYSNRLQEWNSRSDLFQQDSIQHLNQFIQDREEFLGKASTLLQRVYTKGSADNQWTDAIGSLNSAISAISQGWNTGSEKYVVCFSDMEQSVPNPGSFPKLNEIPSGVQVLALNPVPGSSKMISADIQEIEHPDRLSEIIF